MKNKQHTVYRTPIDRLMESRTGILVIAALAIVMALIFIFGPGNYKKIEREEAIAYSGQFEEYEIMKNMRCIHFADGMEHYVYPHTESMAFQERMNVLPKGTTLHLLINPNGEYVLEIRTDTEELLSFDAEQEAIASYVRFYVWFGIAILLCAAFLVWFVFKKASSDKLEQQAQEQKEAKRESGLDDTALRRADFSQKHRVLLEKKISGYEICYRRVKNVNELVINGLVYDEKKAIVEFAHTLSASIDGHLIEAGLDSANYSFIAIDGRIIELKRRLV